MDGGADKAGPAKSAKHQVLLPTNFDTMANERSTLEQLNTTTAGMLKASSHELEMSRKKAVWKDVQSPRNSPEISLVGTELPDISGHKKIDPRRRLYLVDMHALCYDGNRAQPSKVIEWMKLLLSQVAQDNPIIAVMDGERGNEYRKALMPEYKAKRNQFRPLAVRSWRASTACGLREALPLIQGFLTLCHIPVVKLEMAEADDVIATLASQAQGRGLQVVVASPDMDFRQLLAPDVHMLLPLPEIGRWSFYTLQHYVTQNNMTPDLDLGLRCLLGDATDNISGLSTLDPRFGRKTALKLMQKHGSLEGLLKAAATRTVGKDYIQGALVQHADLLRRNMQVLSLRTDVPVVLKDQWCQPRSDVNDLLALELLTERLQS
jgi:5'-3' exonuclease